MDDELRGYLENMEGRLAAKVEASEGHLMARLNDSEERMLNRLTPIERDFDNTKGFLIDDALVSSGRWWDLEARVTRLEGGRR